MGSPQHTGPALAERVVLDASLRTKLAKVAYVKFGITGSVLEDLLQETTVELLQLRAPVEKPDGLIFRIFFTRCCRYLGRPERRETTVGLDVEERAVTDPLVERLAVVYAGFQTLSPLCRQILQARYVEGKSLRETATSVARAYSGINTLMNRCLEKLKTWLAR